MTSPCTYRFKKEEVQNLGDLDARLSEAQKVVAGSDGKSISEEIITATVWAPGLPNLSMVDLPGINRESLEREDSTVRLIKKWIDREETVIVVVVKAANDLASSKGYQMAQEVDPVGDRTLLVMTNCDGSLANKEETIADLLRNKGKRLFAVKCFRSRDDERTREELLNQEVKFFSDSAIFRGHSNVGTLALIQALGDMLYYNLQPRWQEILAHTKKRKRELNKELEERKAGREILLKAIDECLYRIRQEIEEQVTGTRRFQKNSLYFRCRSIWKAFGEKIISEAESLKKTLPKRISEERQEQIGRELDKLANNFSVMERIIAKLVDDFKPAVEKMISDTQTIVADALASVLQEYISKSRLLSCIPDLLCKLGRSVAETREAHEDEALTRVLEILEMQRTIFLNNPAIEDILSDKFSQLPENRDDSASSGGSGGGDGGNKDGGFDLSKEMKQLNGALKYGLQARAVDGEIVPTLISFAAGKLGIPVLLAQGLVKLIQSRSSSSSADIHEWDDVQRLQLITDYYIDVVCERVVDAVPMAVVYFFNKRLAKDICKLVPHVSADDVDEFLSHPDREEENRRLEEKYQQWSRLAHRLSSE